MSLWEELKSRVKQVDDQTNVVGGMSYDHVKERTSSEIDSDGLGTIFDETIVFYGKRRDSAQAFLVNALNESHQTAFRPYLSKAQWAIVGGDSTGKQSAERPLRPSTHNHTDIAQLNVTPELDEPLRVSKCLSL
jgi:hypothetical protein